MSESYLFGLQQSLFQALSGDTMLMDIATHIYDHLPDDATYPCIVIGDAKEEDIAADAAIAHKVTATIYCYSKASGRKQTLNMLQRLHGLLHHGNLNLNGATVSHIRVQEMQTRLHPSHELVEGIAKMIALIEPWEQSS